MTQMIRKDLKASPLTLTMATHLMMDRPKPDRAPQRPATVLDRHSDSRNPSQLKRKETKTHGTFYCFMRLKHTSPFINLS